MWIERTKNGYRAVERYIDPITAKDKRVSVAIAKNTAATRRAAEKVLQEKITKKTTATHSSTTFSELLAEWLKHQQASCKPSTYQVCIQYSKKLESAIGSDCLLDRLTARYTVQRIEKVYKYPSRYNTAISHLKSILRWGYDNDFIQDITWISKMKPKKDTHKKKALADKYLEHEELDTLLQSLTKEKWYELTLFLALTGVRVGEALALDYTDIDLKNREIHITKTLSPITKEIQPAKTEDSVRTIYIQDELIPLCTRLRNRASMNRFINPLVFHGCKYHGYYDYLAEHSIRVLGRKITPHVLRHTHVALLAEQGVSLETISRRLGHRDTGITRDVYFHVTDRLKEKDNMAIKAVNLL